jgi:hypothetical protein
VLGALGGVVDGVVDWAAHKLANPKPIAVIKNLKCGGMTVPVKSK